MRVFRDRAEAGRALARELAACGTGAAGDAVVLGLPRGGVVVAAEVARALKAPLDVAVVRKIGAPGNPEFAIAAVDGDGVVVGDPSPYAGEAYVATAVAAQREEIVRREHAYRSGRTAVDTSGRTAIVVDDGVATGLTALAALRWLRRHGAKRIVFAAPVGAPGSLRALAEAADEVVVLETPIDFVAVGQAYADFRQVEDDEVIRALREAAPGPGPAAPEPERDGA